jgi:tryptophan-rich sensory protein
MTVTIRDVVLALLPAVVGYGSQLVCSVGKNAGSSVLFRPPAWAFGVIWPILFLLFGLSWVVAVRESPTVLTYLTYALTTTLLGVWILVYGCTRNKRAAVWILLLAVAMGLASFGQGTGASKAMIAPLIAWAIFALLMNTTEVQMKGGV